MSISYQVNECFGRQSLESIVMYRAYAQVLYHLDAKEYDVTMDISEKIKQARMSASLTQEDVAEKLGVSRQTISSWENGKSYPDVTSLFTLSDVYNVTVDSLVKGDKEMINHLKESTNVRKG